MAIVGNDLTDLVAATGTEMAPALLDTCTITRAAVTSDAMGGTVYNFTSGSTTIATAQPCNIQNVGPRESEDFARRGIKVTNKIFFSTEIATLLGDRCVVASDPTHFYVVTFISDMADMASAFKVYVNLVQ